MLALDFVKANRETVERAIHDKGVGLDLDELLALDSAVRGFKTEIESLRAERNAISASALDSVLLCFPGTAPHPPSGFCLSLNSLIASATISG